MGVLIEVKANENSTSGGVGAEVTGITLQKGDIISSFCDFVDKWKLLDDQEAFNLNANGKDGLFSTVGDTNQRLITGSLVGSFDNGKTFFSIGLFSQFPILVENPVLKLYCCDSDKNNNSGSIMVHIKKTN